ncbi:MAG: zinc ribbon domain-containing protein [Solirubrobacteraceae bacterium]|nr:zinc ribbon domain-containing protein [Solirubrobacteraceae bacterium]
MDVPDQSQGPAPRACPDCGAAVAQGQRRCTNCGASVDARRRLPRRTPLIAAVSVLGLSGIAVVVAQAAVTEQAGVDASAPADVASAPVAVQGPALPAPSGPTSTPPKIESAEIPESTTPTLNIPAITPTTPSTDTTNSGPDGDPVDDDTAADPDDLQQAKTIKVKRAKNYDPLERAGVEFGKPKAAIDKRSRTVWDVNVPADGEPFNVGIVLDLGDEAKKVAELKISTPTPKFGAVIYRADSAEIPATVDDKEWKLVSSLETVSDDVTVPMSEDGDTKWARYILVFLTTPISPDDTRAAISNLEVLP